MDEQPRIVDRLEVQCILGESQIHEVVIGRRAFDVRVIASDALTPFPGRSGGDVVNALYGANLLVEVFVPGKDHVHVLDDFGLEHPLQVGIRAVAPRQEPTFVNIGMDCMVKIDGSSPKSVKLAEGL